MTQLVKPILDSTYGKSGVYIENGTIYNNGVAVSTAKDSKISDIIEFKNYPLNVSTLKLWLKSYGFNDLINSLIINDDGRNLVSTGELNGVYAICVGDRVTSLVGSGLRFSELKTAIDSRLNSIKQNQTIVEEIYNRVFPEDTDLPIQLIKKGNISDYVSFTSLVYQTGSSVVKVGESDITFDGTPMLGFYNEGPNRNLRLIEEKLIPITERIVKPGDILDLALTYKLKTASSDVITLTDPPTEKTEQLRPDQVPITFSTVEDFDKLTFDGIPILFDGYEITVGQYHEYALSSMIIVKDSSMILMNRFLVEIDEDRIVVYSISDDIDEYYIKSCRLIRRAE